VTRRGWIAFAALCVIWGIPYFFIKLALVEIPPVDVAWGRVAFGAAVGLIYYSSLFYSMDVGETKGEHGGFHEAAIGAGIFAGPAFGAAALQFFPRHPHSGTWAVSGLLLAGLAGMIWLRLKK